jgi:Cys-rich four helix bundle protein (predicted Tat secretion target)
MDRRDAIKALGAVTLAAVSSANMAAEMNHEHMHEHNHDSSGANGSKSAPPPFDLLVQPAADCIRKAQSCLSHCIYLLGEGQKDMASCARSVNELLPLCNALESLALQHGKQLANLVPVVMAAAQACETECHKHAEHAPCKECGEACSALLQAGKQFQREFAAFQQSLK